MANESAAPVSGNHRPIDDVLVAQSRRDELPDSVNLHRIGEDRQLYLQEQATRYISAADTNPRTQERSLDYNSFAGILNHLADRNDLNDLEKAYIWSNIADRKGQADNWSNRFENADYSISLDGSKDEIRDSQPGRAWNTPNHSVLSFLDGYHGFGNPTSGENQSLAYLDRDEANRRIRDHESFLGFSLNDGDIQASQRVVAAFRQYRTSDWGDKFEAFANEWQIQMLETRGDDARDIGQRFSDLGGRAPSQQLQQQLRDLRSETEPAPGAPVLAALDPALRTQVERVASQLEAMPERGQLPLQGADSAERLNMLLARSMNERGVPEPNFAFANGDRSAVFVTATDPSQPQAAVAHARVEDANRMRTEDVVAGLQQSQQQREQAVLAQRTQDVPEQAGPSLGARA